jgi:hypothetical protein
MKFIPRRVLYDDFPGDGIFGITNREALELAIDGALPAFYHIAIGFDLVGNSMVGPKYMAGSYGKFHGPIAQLPRGILVYLETHGRIFFESTTAIQIEGFYGEEFGPPAEPAAVRSAFESEDFFWLTLEKGDTFEFTLGRLIFMRADLEALAATRTPETIKQDPSDAALGAEIRQQRQLFARRQSERQGELEIEHQRWRLAAGEIQRSRKNETSKRQLAALVKDRLQLPDSIETIRKHL